MFIINAYDKSKEVDGVWKEFQGARFRIASSQSTVYKKALVRLAKKQGNKKEVDIDENISLLCEAMAEGLLLDWEDVGFIDDKGNLQEVPYSKEKAKEALITNYDLREFVQEVADDLEEYKREYIEDVVKK